MADFTLYTNPYSRGRTARWMCEEIRLGAGAEPEYIMLDFGPQMKTPDYLALNPMGKVPTLVHGDVVVTEVAAIVAYLAQSYPEAGLGPREGELGPFLRWLFFAAGPLEAAFIDKGFGLSPEGRDQGRVGYGSAERVVETLGHVLKGRDWIVGDRFTGADLYLGAVIGWLAGSGALEAPAVLKDYAARCADRPAARAAAALEEAASEGTAG